MYINMLNARGVPGNFQLYFSGKSLQHPKSTWAPTPMLTKRIAFSDYSLATTVSSLILCVRVGFLKGCDIIIYFEVFTAYCQYSVHERQYQATATCRIIEQKLII